jgi:hypothetical protein
MAFKVTRSGHGWFNYRSLKIIQKKLIKIWICHNYEKKYELQLNDE